MSERKRVRGVGAILALAVLVPGSVGLNAAAELDCDAVCQADLERARAATERYWDVSTAIAEGFVERSGCGSTLDGAVGIEYLHPARAHDQTVDVGSPQALLYIPEGLGAAHRIGAGRRLVAVEYSVPVLDDGQEPPELFGRRFHGPVAGPDTVARYRLRVWLFAWNPNGLFAEANPAEACDAAGLVAPDANEEGVHEILARFSVPPDSIRETLDVPDELELRGEANGEAEIWVISRFSRWGRDAESATPTSWTMGLVPLVAPEWADDPTKTFATLYPFSWLTDNPEFAEWMSHGMGVGSDVIAHSSDIARDFDPIVAATGAYRFSSPHFALEATITDATPVDFTTSLRIWHESPAGMGLLRLWYDIARLGVAVVEVTPTPDTLLAALIGCDPGPDAGSCQPIAAESGLVVTGHAVNPYKVAVSPNWWNPRRNSAG